MIPIRPGTARCLGLHDPRFRCVPKKWIPYCPDAIGHLATHVAKTNDWLESPGFTQLPTWEGTQSPGLKIEIRGIGRREIVYVIEHTWTAPQAVRVQRGPAGYNFHWQAGTEWRLL